MRNAICAASVALLSLAAAPVHAMPVAPLDAAPEITLVAQGCGPGWYRGPYGRCRPMGYAPGYVVPAPRVYGYYGYRPYPYARRCWWRAGVRVCA